MELRCYRACSAYMQAVLRSFPTKMDTYLTLFRSSIKICHVVEEALNDTCE